MYYVIKTQVSPLINSAEEAYRQAMALRAQGFGSEILTEDEARDRFNSFQDLNKFALENGVVTVPSQYYYDIPNYGELMPREKWLQAVEDGGFVDYDGFANPSNGEKISRDVIYPSEFEKLPEDATHVVWYNR